MVSCSKKNEEKIANSEKKRYLNMALLADPASLNPVLIADVSSHAVTSFIFNGLFRRDVDLKIVKDLVKDYSVDASGTVYTFILKKGIQWHDGKAFKAKDVVFTFQTILSPLTNTVRRNHFIIKGKPVLWEAISDYEVRATLPSPYSPFLELLTIGIIPEHIFAGKDVNKHPNNQQPIGTGPFMLKEWRSSHFLKLVKNKNYYEGVPLLDGIIYKVIPDMNTAFFALERGEIHLQGIPVHEVVSRKERRSDIKIQSFFSLNYSYVLFNLDHPLLSNVKIRRALSAAVDRRVLIDKVLYGYGEAAYVPSSILSWAHPNASITHRYTYEPEKTKSLLKAEGYRLNKKGVFEKFGKPLMFTLLIPKGSSDIKKIAQLLQHFFSESGIKLSIQQHDWASFLKILRSKDIPRAYDMALLGWQFDINDPDDMYASWHSSGYPSGTNLGGYKDKRVDALLEKGRLLLDRDSRKKVYDDLFTIIAEDVPSLFLFYPKTFVGIHQSVRGVTEGPGGPLKSILKVSFDE